MCTHANAVCMEMNQITRIKFLQTQPIFVIEEAPKGYILSYVPELRKNLSTPIFHSQRIQKRYEKPCLISISLNTYLSSSPQVNSVVDGGITVFCCKNDTMDSVERAKTCCTIYLQMKFILSTPNVSQLLDNIRSIKLILNNYPRHLYTHNLARSSGKHVTKNTLINS